MCTVQFAVAELGQKCLEAAPTLKINMGPHTATSLYSAFKS